MKWILVLGSTLLINACVYRSTEIVEYRQVTAAPVVAPVILEVENPAPLDVTTTRIDFY